MEKKKLIFTIGLVLVLAMAIMVTSQQTINAQECKIIRISHEKGASGSLVGITPSTLTITKGTCVVWVNFVPAQQVKVMFEEDGKKCADATSAHVGFKMVENCFVTDFIPLGGTSSLHFKEAGTFKYQIAVPGSQKSASPTGVSFGEIQGEGVIVVK